MKKANTKLPADLCVVSKSNRHGIFCGHKPFMTPAGNPYWMPTADLAHVFVDEWKAQGEKIVSATMPMTQLAATTLDIIAKNRESVVRSVIAYAATDLLCHRADQPSQLVQRQQEVWQPLLDWCALQFKALLNVGVGVMPVAQTQEAVGALHEAVSSFDDFALAGLSHAVDVTGSLVLGLALAKHERRAADVFKAAELDSSFQVLTWGDDPVTTSRFDAIRRDLDNCERWFGLLAA